MRKRNRNRCRHGVGVRVIVIHKRYPHPQKIPPSIRNSRPSAATRLFSPGDVDLGACLASRVSTQRTNLRVKYSQKNRGGASRDKKNRHCLRERQTTTAVRDIHVVRARCAYARWAFPEGENWKKHTLRCGKRGGMLRVNKFAPAGVNRQEEDDAP